MPTLNAAAAAADVVSSFRFSRELDIAAPSPLVWESILEQLGPESQMPDGKPFPMKLEAWPGGRWYRDLGEGVGHLWAHVQVIKPPTLLELCGPLFMSYPALSHVQYRVTAVERASRLTIVHRALGHITDEHREGVHTGWEYELQRIRAGAEARAR